MRRVGLLVGLAEDDPETKSRVRALFVNMTAAKALGLSVPESFLQLADEVIE
jgi:hypothetical protein